MTIYQHSCSTCGEMELERRMRDPQPTTCPQCGGYLERIYSAHLHGAVDAGQENENRGMGKWYPQMGTQFLDAKTKRIRNPESHARSRADALDKCKRKGWSVEKT